MNTILTSSTPHETLIHDTSSAKDEELVSERFASSQCVHSLLESTMVNVDANQANWEHVANRYVLDDRGIESR